MEEASLEIELPSDDDGFILLKCPHCGELFKLTAQDIKSDKILNIYCPACGLTADDFFTQDVIDLALAMSKNAVMDEITRQFQFLAKNYNDSLIEIEVETNHKKEPELPIRPSIEALQVTTCHDCGRQAKISPLLAMSAYTCPLCGIGQFNER